MIRFFSGLVFILFCAVFLPPVYCAQTVDKIVAIVNDEIITQSELDEFTAAFIADYNLRYGSEMTQDKLDTAKNDALNRLIEEKLIMQEANKRNIQVDEADIEDAVKSVKTKFESEEEFDKAISASGLTIDKLRAKYKNQLMIRELVNGIVSHNINVSPTQIAAYYYGHKNEFVQPASVKFSIIVLKFKPDQEKDTVRVFARELLDRINSGEDFSGLATKYSEGPKADDGGDMGFVSKGTMMKEIDDAIFSLKNNEVSDVIETSAGCNIVKVAEKMQELEFSLKDATARIRERLYEREAELMLREFVDKLKKDAYLEIK
ncbi:MAG: peptidylprolyl isomerase [Candidatus Omnitrophota bacterium]